MKHSPFQVWSPTEEIPKECSWDESMKICRGILCKDKIDVVVVILNEYTQWSCGVEEEVQIAARENIPVYALLEQETENGYIYQLIDV